MSGRTAAAKIELFMAQSGGGKGLSIRDRLSSVKPSSLLIWDPQNEYDDFAIQISSIREVGEVIAQSIATNSAFNIRYVPAGVNPLPKEFALLCRYAYHCGKLLFIAEELPDVTKPSWPTPEWRTLVNQGRHREIHIIGATQRPALIDKTVIGNATLLRVGSLAETRDRRAMAQALDIHQAEVDQLRVDRSPRLTRTLMIEREDRGDTCRLVQISITKAGKVALKKWDLPTLRKRSNVDDTYRLGFDSGPVLISRSAK